MATFAVLPVKTFPRAKTRIGGLLADADRAVLTEAMVGDVLEALARVRGLAGVLVVTSEPRAVEAAARHGAEVVPEPAELGHSAAAAAGAAHAVRLGADRVLLVPGDCPALDPAEVGRLLARDVAAPEVVVVPDRHGAGTNALLITPPELMRPSFGEGSCARHAALARAAGAAVCVCHLPSLALDVDTPEDLVALTAGIAARPEAAPRTRAALARLAPAPERWAS